MHTVKDIYYKFSHIKFKIELLPWENFYKEIFSIKVKIEDNHLFYEISKNKASCAYFMDALFYKEEKTCFYKNMFNFFQQMTINNPNYPYAYHASTNEKNILKILDNLGFIEIVSIDDSIYFNKLRSFEEKDAMILIYLLQENNINSNDFHIKSKKQIIFLKLKPKKALKEIKSIRTKINVRKEELIYIKQTFKNFLFQKEEAKPLTLKLEKSRERKEISG